MKIGNLATSPVLIFLGWGHLITWYRSYEVECAYERLFRGGGGGEGGIWTANQSLRKNQISRVKCPGNGRIKENIKLSLFQYLPIFIKHEKKRFITRSNQLRRELKIRYDTSYREVFFDYNKLSSIRGDWYHDKLLRRMCDVTSQTKSY